jgi:muramidase (phage lysozyme)
MDKTVPKPAAMLLDFIASKEAPRGYDTVYGNRMSQMPKPLTSMTMKEVLDQGKWRTKTFGSSACGRYQFMDATLRDLATELDLKAEDKFTPDYQDRLGLYLLRRRGYEKWIAGRISDHDFMIGLGQEWASFPMPYQMKGAHRTVQRGQSYYAGDGLNKALVGAEAVETTLTKAKSLAGGVPLPPERPAPSPAALAAMAALIAALVAVAALLGIDAETLKELMP